MRRIAFLSVALALAIAALGCQNQQSGGVRSSDSSPAYNGGCNQCNCQGFQNAGSGGAICAVCGHPQSSHNGTGHTSTQSIGSRSGY